MDNQKTVILNKEDLEGYLDFNNPDDLNAIIHVLNRLMKTDTI